MLKYFLCPDGTKKATKECLEQCPRSEGRCLSLPTLTTIGQTREWSSKPSTTQCLNPTRMEYLRIKYDFTIDPFDQAFALLGTRHHGRLEQVAKKIEGLEAEIKLKGEVSGVLDLLEPMNGSEEYRLIDYKTFGSYAVAKQLGIKEHGESDKWKLTMQMNNYRIMAQDLGFNVVELKAQITVRDGNTFSARNNKIDKNLYLLPVEILPDNKVREYFTDKVFQLCHAVETDTLPNMCSYEDHWGNRRCKGYCPVFSWCPEGAKINKVVLQQ